MDSYGRSASKLPGIPIAAQVFLWIPMVVQPPSYQVFMFWVDAGIIFLVFFISAQPGLPAKPAAPASSAWPVVARRQRSQPTSHPTKL